MLPLPLRTPKPTKERKQSSQRLQPLVAAGQSPLRPFDNSVPLPPGTCFPSTDAQLQSAPPKPLSEQAKNKTSILKVSNMFKPCRAGSEHVERVRKLACRATSTISNREYHTTYRSLSRGVSCVVCWFYNVCPSSQVFMLSPGWKCLGASSLSCGSCKAPGGT
ncbi:hypothetical protein HOY80DRAFT_770745 [Tuber brumale]|nr:hypothetical protein HOY80DRAFT_770745 [Tuber brumale]